MDKYTARKILGVKQGMNEIELKRARDKAIFKHHPDKNKNSSITIDDIKSAYNLLNNESLEKKDVQSSTPHSYKYIETEMKDLEPEDSILDKIEFILIILLMLMIPITMCTK